jgi:hypothetical protein
MKDLDKEHNPIQYTHRQLSPLVSSTTAPTHRNTTVSSIVSHPSSFLATRRGSKIRGGSAVGERVFSSDGDGSASTKAEKTAG